MQASAPICSCVCHAAAAHGNMSENLVTCMPLPPPPASLALRAGARRNAAGAAPCPAPRPGRWQCRPPKRAPAGAMLYRRIPESHHWQQRGPGRQFLHHGPHAPQPACHASYSRHPRAAPNPRRIRAQHTIQEEKKGRRNSRVAHEIVCMHAWWRAWLATQGGLSVLGTCQGPLVLPSQL